MWSVDFLQNPMLIEQRQCTRETCIEFGWQRDEMDDSRRAQCQHAGSECQQADRRRARHDAQERGDHQHASADLFNPPRGLHKARPDAERSVTVMVLQRVSDFVSRLARRADFCLFLFKSVG